MQLHRLLLTATTVLLLASCAVQPGREVVAEARKALESTTVCCQDLSTAIRSPIPLIPTKVLIDKTQPAFNFGGQKAYFVLYELPAYERPYSIFLTSQAAGTLQDVAIFIPRVAMYDADFKVTRFFDERTLRNRGNDLERTVFINPSNQQERYIAVYGADLSASIERQYSMVTVQTISTGFVTFNIYGGQDGKSTLRASPVGSLQIEVKGLATASK